VESEKDTDKPTLRFTVLSVLVILVVGVLTGVIVLR
jgi:hypothetical protein